MPAAHPITDHEQIRHWAEERGARPTCVKGTGGKGDPGMIRLDMPGYSGARSLQPISWDEWFRQFDENNLALLVQDETARGQRSNFNKLVGRETVKARRAGKTGASRRSIRKRGGTNEGTSERRTAKSGRSGRSKAKSGTTGARKGGASKRAAAKTSGRRTSSSRTSSSAGRGRSAKSSATRTRKSAGGSKKK